MLSQPPLDAGAALTCADGDFRLVGTLAGKDIDIKATSAGGGYVRINPANFDSQYSNFAVDPERTQLALNWTDDFANDTFNATGTLLMGTRDPLPGQSFCLGNGTQVNFPQDGSDDGSMEFKLQGITRGPNCTTPVTGSLMGCFL